MTDILIFNVELGQCIFFFCHESPEYTLMIDCGNTPNFDPIDFLISKRYLSKGGTLKNLTLTNYDQDHYSGLPYLRKIVKIETVAFPKNLSGEEIKALKPQVTEAVKEVVNILETYTSSVSNYTPPYTKECFQLSKTDFPNEKIDTNKLSRAVFLTYNGVTICIPGDLTSPAWELLLRQQGFRNALSRTTIFVASHHGREDGYNDTVFQYCKPEVIILSDKDIMHQTQIGQTQLYGSKVIGNGIDFYGTARKTLTTRNDGHIWVRIDNAGNRTYKSFKA